jgi:hypothetical protein
VAREALALEDLVHRPVDVAVPVPPAELEVALVDRPAPFAVRRPGPAQREDCFRDLWQRRELRVVRQAGVPETVDVVLDRPCPFEIENRQQETAGRFGARLAVLDLEVLPDFFPSHCRVEVLFDEAGREPGQVIVVLAPRLRCGAGIRDAHA